MESGVTVNCIDRALTLAQLGYPVFPCRANGKAPATAHGFHDATTDPNRIAEMFDNAPDANIGLATDGLVVIDLDPVDGEANPWAETVPDSLEPGLSRSRRAVDNTGSFVRTAMRFATRRASWLRASMFGRMAGTCWRARISRKWETV